MSKGEASISSPEQQKEEYKNTNLRCTPLSRQ